MKIYTLEDVCVLMKCNKKTLQRLCSKGELKGYKKLRKWYVLESDLIEWITKE